MAIRWGSQLDWQGTIIDSLLERFCIVEKRLGFDLLRPEAKILLALSSKGELSIKELMIESGMSYRGFYLVFTRLTEQGLIDSETDLRDKRVRKVRITADASRMIEDLTKAA
jgi:DNA-binding MarR family transcriptional regulator